jgi:hypothetical protein
LLNSQKEPSADEEMDPNELKEEAQRFSPRRDEDEADQEMEPQAEHIDENPPIKEELHDF